MIRHTTLTSLALLTIAAGANAAIVSTTGPVIPIAAPPSLLVGAMASTTAFAIDEKQNVYYNGPVDSSPPSDGTTP